jgi:hypothetical protein
LASTVRSRVTSRILVESVNQVAEFQQIIRIDASIFDQVANKRH